MEAKVNYTLVGVSVVILLTALLAFSLWISVGFDKKAYSTYAVFMKEAVSGISKDAAVKFNGVKVGKVKQIALNHSNPQEVILLLSIEEGTPITKSTYASIISQGFTGLSYVGLKAEGSNLVPLKADKDYPYPIIPSRPSLFDQIDKTVQIVSENISSVATKIKQVFDEENVLHLKQSLANIATVSDTLAKNANAIDDTLKQLNLLSRRLAQVSDDFPEMVTDFKNVTLSIKKASKEVSVAMQSGRVTMDKLSQQTVPAASVLMNNLSSVAENLEKITAMVERNPSVLIRGKVSVKPGPGER